MALDKERILTDLKILLNIDDTELNKLAWLSLKIDKTELYIKTYCNNDFINADTLNYEFPDTLVGVLEDLIVVAHNSKSYEGKGSEGIGDYSINLLDDIPKPLKRIMNKFKLMVVR